LAAAVLIVAVVAGSLSLAYLLTWRLPPPLEAFAVATAALVIASFMWPDQFQYHYAAFFAPWLSLAIALPLAALVRDLRLVSGGDGATPPALQRGAAGLAGLLILVLAVVQFGSESHVIAHLPLSVVTSARHLIPPGACLLADEVSFSVVTDRLVSDVPGCSLLPPAQTTPCPTAGIRIPAPPDTRRWTRCGRTPSTTLSTCGCPGLTITGWPGHRRCGATSRATSPGSCTPETMARYTGESA
jgi:hypothetical protein